MASVISDPNGYHRVVFKGLDGQRRPTASLRNRSAIRVEVPGKMSVDGLGRMTSAKTLELCGSCMGVCGRTQSFYASLAFRASCRFRLAWECSA